MNLIFYKKTTTIILTIASALLLSSPLFAGECKTDKQGTNLLIDAPTKSSGVRTEVLSQFSLETEKIKLIGRKFRIRNIIIKPGGHVLLHSHDDRPALAMITQGEVIEHVNNCLEPVFFKTGEIIQERKGITHWVENHTDNIAILTVSDIFNESGNSQGNF